MNGELFDLDEALRDKCEELADDVRPLTTLLHSW